MKAKKKAPVVTEPDRMTEIYNVAAQLICEKGFDATSMNDIADEVGITKAGIYHYIEDKKSLLFGIMNFGMDRLETHVIRPARAVADPEQRLRTIINNHALLITSGNNARGHNPITILIEELAGLNPAQRRKIEQRKRAYFDFLRETMTKLKTEGKLKEVDTTVAAFSLFGMLLWLSHWYRPNGRLKKEQVVEEITKIALGGLLRPTARLNRK
ncbi:MAG TPA: TetR/AcrR family transcriptional regulator [Blastocatellia bacterium]|nr:TetR/AcrR family transcriptional regulator [Blastocatellia bacterium]